MSSEHTILVVDDNATNRKILVRAFEKDGYNVREAPDGFVAVDLARELQPALLLLDVMMPGRDGLEVCEILKSDDATAEIPIIFVTAKSDSEDLERAFAIGGCDYVTKPFRLSEVRARVSVHLTLRKAQNELVNRNQRLEEMSRIVAETNLKLARQARMDSLTSLFNRRAWEECVTSEHDRHLRHSSPYSLLMLDVDQFKPFNDTLGHQAGDRCLKSVAKCLLESCRGTDIVGRYGGEEFVILAPETDGEAALLLGERVRSAVAALEIAHPASAVAATVTVSVGVAESSQEHWATTLRTADLALYAAKQTGRNCVCDAKDIPRADAERRASRGGPPALDTKSEAAVDGERARVLIVLANPEERSALRTPLEEAGYAVTESPTETDGLQALSCSLPAAVVLDASLPNEGALRITRSVRESESERHTSVIVIGPQSTPEEVRDFGIAGADECIAHPMCPIEIERRIRYVLRRTTSSQSLAASYDNRGEQTRILMMLFEFCRNLVDCRSRRAVLEEAAQAVSEITGCRQIVAMVPSQGTDSMEIEGCVGFELESGAPVHVANSPVADVLATGRTVVLNDGPALQSRGSETDAWFDGHTPQLFVAIPVGDSIVAVIAAGHRVTGQPFDQRVLDTIDLVVGVAATALHEIATATARDRARDAIMIAFAKLAEHRDDATHRHVERVTKYSLTLARSLRETEEYRDQLTDAMLDDLERAAPLHDIGKVAIPDYILLKKGKLSPEETAIMQKHAQAGADTIRSVRMQSPDFTMLEVAEQIAGSHHEWFDGSGYPAGLSGQSIPLVARIVAVADAYDAITTSRPYKGPISHETAVTLILEASGTQFDPTIVEALVRAAAQFDLLRKENTDGDWQEADEAQKDRALIVAGANSFNI